MVGLPMMLLGCKVVLERPPSCSSKPLCYHTSVVLLCLITWCQKFGNFSRKSLTIGDFLQAVRLDSELFLTHYSHSSVACSAFDVEHVESWGKIMTDLCLTLAILTGGELSNILWLTFGIFALWRILLTQLKMLTRMTIGSEPNDRRKWLPYEGLSLLNNGMFLRLP